MFQQTKRESDETANVVQESDQESACVIDKTKYSSLRKLLRVRVFVLKFIKKKVWSRCTNVLKEMICTKHKIYRLIDKLKDNNVYSQDIKAVRLFWVFIIQHKKICRCGSSNCEETTKWSAEATWLDTK